MSGWTELSIAGPRRDLDALLREEPAKTFSDCRLDLADESLGERLLEKAHLDTHHRVYLAERDEPAFLERLAGHGELQLAGRRRNLRGRFSFRAATPARVAAEKIQAALEEKREGVVVRRRDEKETGDPSAHGVHLYDRSAHEYFYEMAGEAEGSAPGIFELHEQLEGLEFVNVERIEVDGETVQP
jgi:hypothetical protein